MSNQKVFVKLEKKLACDLRPGDLFIEGREDPEAFVSEMSGYDLAAIIMVRTNAPADDVDGGDMRVYKLHFTVVDRETPAPPRVNPHAPPGAKER